MALYTLTCSGTACGGATVLGTLELPSDADPTAAAWGHLCDVCADAWRAAIDADQQQAVKGKRPPAHPRDLAPLGPPRQPRPHPQAGGHGR